MHSFLVVSFVLLSGYLPYGIRSHSNNHQVYSKESNVYHQKIQRAKKLYSNHSCSGYKCFVDTISKDLSPFSSGIDLEMIQLGYQRGVKYVVLNKRIYRQKDCLFPSRCEGVDYFLNSIRKAIPDTHFVVNFHDWPQINKHFQGKVPVFSFSKTDDYYDIMYPTWSFWKGGPALTLYPTGIGRWDQFHDNLVRKSESMPWDEKISAGFFIGSRTSSERDNLILLSRAQPDLVVAKYTKNQAWKSDKDTLNHPPADEVPLEDHCNYKYLFNFRGVAASFRLKFLFMCKSTVIHVGDEWKEFFYDSLKPWYHYIPMESSASQNDYRSIIDFLKQEDSIAKEIANRGFTFIHDNLKLDDVKNYWKVLLKKYTKLLKFDPRLDSSLIEVTSTSSS
uniref:O-glucosyltransferase rumi n=1 Tax=Lygus hesperus TaxID=30085 RepID=A0A0A9WEI7_LYGHE